MKRNTFLIPVPADFRFAECRWFLDRNYDDCTHLVKEAAVYKALTVADELFLVMIRDSGPALEVSVLQGAVTDTAREGITAYIREWMDMDRDITPFYALLRQEERVAYMAEAFAGLRMTGVPDLFEALCWSIIGQQINLAFAYKLKRRLVERYGAAIMHNGHAHLLFPTPEAIASADPAELRAMQLSASKITYLKTAANAFVTGLVSKAKLAALPDLAARQQLLTGMKGIGTWTANYTLMKTFKELSCIPYGDAGLLNALVAHGVLADKKDRAALDGFFAGFPGWESYLVFYLWRSRVTQ